MSLRTSEESWRSITLKIFHHTEPGYLFPELGEASRLGSLQTKVGGFTRAMSGIGEKKGRRREEGGGLAWVAVIFAEVTFYVAATTRL